MTDIVRIVLIDDHAVVREGLRTLLEIEPGFKVVGEAGSGDEALHIVPALTPDVIMIDLIMPGLSAPNTIRALKLKLPACNIIVFTSFAEDDNLRETLQAGAIGYLLKDAARHDLTAAVRAVASGQPWLHETMQRQLMELLRKPAPTDPLASLTAGERRVLALIGEGLSNRTISQRLDLTEGTVKGYVSSLLGKLGLRDRTQAALMVARQAPKKY